MEQIHDDVLSATLSYYNSKMRNGEHFEPAEFQDMVNIVTELQSRLRNELAESMEFFKSVEENSYLMAKRSEAQSKLFDCFLKIHDLDYEFEVFCDRVEYRRIKAKRNKK